MVESNNNPQLIEEHNRTGRLRWARMACRELVEHRVRRSADQLWRLLSAEAFAQMAGNSTYGHAARMHGDRRVIEARQVTLVRRHPMQVEAGAVLTHHGEWLRAGVGDYSLAILSDTDVAHSGLCGQMVVRRRVEHLLRKRFPQPVKWRWSPVEGRLRLRTKQQAGKCGFPDHNRFAAGHRGVRSRKSYPLADQIPDRPRSPDDPLLTARESAAELSISLPAFWKAVADGRLPAPIYVLPRAPRWRRSELRGTVERHRMLPVDAKMARRKNDPKNKSRAQTGQSEPGAPFGPDARQEGVP
jgi:predicted DNA-binding transcriptional regulator AlpA